MYLKTPKRYTAKGSKRRLISLRWLWLYLLAPLILIPSILAWDNRALIGDWIGQRVNQLGIGKPPAATPTPHATLEDPGKVIKDSFASGRINRAITALQVIADNGPNNVGVFSLVTRLLVLRSYSENKQMLADALVEGQQAINANPENAEGWIAMAMALDWDHKPQEALGYILRARDFDDKDAMVLAVMGEIYHDLGREEEALKYVDAAIENGKAGEKSNRAALSHAHYVKALILEATSISGEDAIKEYEAAWRAATADPPDPTIPSGYIAQYLAVYYKNLQQNQKAIELLTDAIKRDQDDPFLPYQLGQVYLNQGDPNKARAYAETCRDLDPNQVRCLRLLAKLSFREQNYTAALETINKVIAMDSKEPNDYLIAGLSYEYLNQCATSIPVLQQGIALIDAGDAQTRASFDDALRGCGAASDVTVPTATPSLDPLATEAPTEAAVPPK